MRRPRTLKQRLLIVLLGLLAAVVATMGALSTLALRDSLLGQLDLRLAESSQRAAAVAPGPPTGEQSPPPDEPDGPAGPPPGLTVPGQRVGTIGVSVDQDVVRSGYIDTDGAFQALTEDQEQTLLGLTPGADPATVDLQDLGDYRVIATTTPQGQFVATGLSLEELQSTVRQYLLTEAAIAAAGIGLAALAGSLVLRRQLRPLESVAATATRVAELPLREGRVAMADRVPARFTDPGTEVGQVGAALNQLLGHVEEALRARHDSETQVRQFVADASHELRTPLASIRGYAELVRRLGEELPPEVGQAMQRVESESHRMTSLVEDLLLLARLDAGPTVHRAPVDLALLAVEAVADAHVAGPDHHWLIDIPDAEGADDAAPAVRGEENQLRQVLANLLANARIHTPAGSTVTTTVRTEDGSVVLDVQDDGPGIPEELLPRLFQRFARGDQARSPGTGSTGLGLAIVDAVVRSHDGRIAVDGTPGATRFTVVFPAG